MLKNISYFVSFLSFVVQLLCAVDIMEPSIDLKNLLKVRKDIIYMHLGDAIILNPKRNIFFDDEICPANGSLIIPETFIVSIPCGRVYSNGGLIIVDGMYVEDFLWEVVKQGRLYPFVDVSKIAKPQEIHGRVAVITQFGAKCYYHWMAEVLPRLALLQKSGILYDYLYIPVNQPYMRETLDLLGIDFTKIIDSSEKESYIQADDLIVPSAPSCLRYSSQFVIEFLRNKFIPLAQLSVDSDKFSKKVFISRRKAASRKIVNEDEVFALFQEYGFVRYDLEELSVLEQVMLFHNAEMIVGEHGAGLTNIMFAKPKTKIIEIFQACKRLTYWYLSQELGLEHFCVKTTNFYIKNRQYAQLIVPLDSIKEIITQLFN